MALFSCKNTRLSGISACVPKQIEYNSNYDWVSEAERASLIKYTGVAERRIAPRHVTASDLCFAAAQKLIADLAWKEEEIEALIFVSQTGDYFLPASSIILQNRLGLSRNCMALDIGLGCSGYVYGLSVTSSLMSSGQIKKAILMTGEKSSFSISPKDKSTYPLFGDAGTATALEFSSSAPDIYFNLQSDGSGFENIIIRDGLTRNPGTEDSFRYHKIEKGIERRPLDLVLNGTGIFDFALREVIPNIKQTLAFCGMNMESIDYYILHQANKLMNETLRKMMKINADKVPYSIHQFGNTSSASIPLTLVTQLPSALKEEKLQLLLCGFGVGLSWGSVILQTDKIVCSDLVEYND